MWVRPKRKLGADGALEFLARFQLLSSARIRLSRFPRQAWWFW